MIVCLFLCLCFCPTVCGCAACRVERGVCCAHSGDPVATAFAWEDDADVGTDLARLHWLGVAPKHRRHGLARALVSRRTDLR